MADDFTARFDALAEDAAQYAAPRLNRLAEIYKEADAIVSELRCAGLTVTWHYPFPANAPLSGIRFTVGINRKVQP